MKSTSCGDVTLTSTRPLILLTNDDGIHSPGLLAVAEAVCDLGDLLMVAPATQQTGMGRGTPPMIDGKIQRTDVTVGCQAMPAYALTGSPAQTVIYGILALAPHIYRRRPDLVISGINYGENLGTCVTGSGTVGAALQAAEMGIPGLAVSLETDQAFHLHHGHDLNWSAAAAITRHFAGIMLAAQLPFDVDVLKIDVPADATAETGWRITRQSRQPYYLDYAPADFLLEGDFARLDYGVHVQWETLEPGSDIHAFAVDRLIAVTPLSQDLTSRVELTDLERLLRKT
jgi:5'/3'-nucleotidase